MSLLIGSVLYRRFHCVVFESNIYCSLFSLQYGMTPLILATKKRSEQMINVLLHAGADVDAESSDVMTEILIINNYRCI